MMITLQGFAGAIPATLDRGLPQNYATIASNFRLLRGDLEPFNVMANIKTVAAGVKTIYLDQDGNWLTWDDVVDVVTGPVKTDRLYITGDGVPKLIADSTTYDLAMPYPTTAPTITAVSDNEKIAINGVQITPTDGATGTAGNVKYTVAVDGREATFTLEPTAGQTITDTAMAAVVDTISYVNTSSDPTEGERVFLITKLVDTGDDSDDGAYNTSTLAIRSVVSVAMDYDDYPEGDDPDPLEYSIDDEYLIIDGTEFKPTDGEGGYTDGLGLSYQVSGSNTYFTITLKSNSGMTPAQAEAVIESIRYVNKGPSDHLTKGTRTFTVNSLTDDGDTNYNTGYVGLITKLYVNDDDVNPSTDAAGTIDDSDLDEENNNPPQAVADRLNATYNVGGVEAQLYDNVIVDPMEDGQRITQIVFNVSNIQNRQYDVPPLATSKSLNPNYAAGSGVVPVFDSTEISVVDVGDQTIDSLEFTVSNLANGNADEETGSTVYYVYTWVSKYDEESLPSEPSEALFYDADMRVRLSGFDTPPAASGNRIDRMRIYRSQTDSLSDTEFYFIAERDVSGADFLDDQLEVVDLLPSADYASPPDDLQGIVSLPNGIMAAFSGKTLCFSEPYIPHAWPTAYQYNLKDTPIALGAYGSNLVVATDGVPYIVSGSTPDSMVQEKSEMAYPCLSALGARDMGYSVVYPSTQGLISVSSAGPQNVTKGLFTPQQWRQLNPSSFIAGEYDDRYIATYTDLDGNQGTLILNLQGDQPYAITTDQLFTASFHELSTDQLFLLQGTTIKQWDAGDGKMRGTWKSKEFFLDSYVSFAAIAVDSGMAGGSFTLDVVADGNVVATITEADKVKRLPPISARSWQLTYEGTANIQRIRMVTAVSELSGG